MRTPYGCLLFLRHYIRGNRLTILEASAIL
nr:MAG TPA_asm: hypothetical protein [Caudoviricetes sp.]